MVRASRVNLSHTGAGVDSLPHSLHVDQHTRGRKLAMRTYFRDSAQ